MASSLHFSIGTSMSTLLKKTSSCKYGPPGSNNLILHSDSIKSINGERYRKVGRKNNEVVVKRSEKGKWRIGCIDDGSCGMPPMFESCPSIVDLINEFYKSINNKNKDKLEEILSPDCEFHDLVFYIPFQGKKEVLDFLQRIMDAMGRTVQFYVENIHEGPERQCTAAVMWHLEWDGRVIPFTTGYSYFECAQEGEELLIRKIKGVEELPVKPGDLLLNMLRAVTAVFDSLPATAKGFLSKSPDIQHAMQMFLNVLRDDHHV